MALLWQHAAGKSMHGGCIIAILPDPDLNPNFDPNPGN